MDMHGSGPGTRDAALFERTDIAKPMVLGPPKGYPGSAVIIAADGALAIDSSGIAGLAGALRRDPCWAEIEDLAVLAIVEGRATVEIVLPVESDNAVETTILPLADGERALVLLHPLRFPNAFQRSLMESRQRYKELVEAVSDFSWETDCEGRFCFISSHGAFGWTPDEIVGRPVSAFLADPEISGLLPGVFRADEAGRSDDVWFRRPDGSSECLNVVAMPVFDATGQWQGSRGLCRTVTEEHRRNRESVQTGLRARLAAHLSYTMHKEIDPERALAGAISAVGLASSAAGAAVFRIAGGGRLVEAAAWGEAMVGGIGGGTLASLAAGAATACLEGAYQVTAVPTRFQGEINGGIVLWRNCQQGPFAVEECATLGMAAEPFGTAIAQLISYLSTLEQSRTDALTGAPNRRAFLDEAARRLSRLERATGGACLLFVDCNNFKLVNDVRGHSAGDAALVDICGILRECSRSVDMVARFGGDEFVMWLEDVNAATAVERAQTIVERCKALAHYTGNPARPFGVSLGLALYDSGQPEGLDQLLARADAAMYAAKRSGAGYALAEPSAEGSAP